MTWHTLAKLSDIPSDAALETGAAGQALALYRVQGEVFCTSNLCTHSDAFLSDGYLEGYEIECPLHGARFDIRNGRAMCPPAGSDVACYAVKVEQGEVMVELPE